MVQAMLDLSSFGCLPPFGSLPGTPAGESLDRMAIRWDGLKLVTRDVLRCIIREKGALGKLRDAGFSNRALDCSSLVVGEVFLVASEIRDDATLPVRFRAGASYWVTHVTPIIGRGLTDRISGLRASGQLRTEVARHTVGVRGGDSDYESLDGDAGDTDDEHDDTHSSHPPAERDPWNFTPLPSAGDGNIGLEELYEEIADIGQEFTVNEIGMFYAHAARDLMESDEFMGHRTSYLRGLGRMLEIIEDIVTDFNPLDLYNPDTQESNVPRGAFAHFVKGFVTHSLRSANFDSKWGDYHRAREQVREAERAVADVALRSAQGVRGDLM